MALMRQLSAEASFEQPKLRIVAAAVGPKDLFVPFGDDREASALGRVDRSLEVDGFPGVDDETVARDALSVDRDVGDGAKRTVVSDTKLVDLSWPCEDVP